MEICRSYFRHIRQANTQEESEEGSIVDDSTQARQNALERRIEEVERRSALKFATDVEQRLKRLEEMFTAGPRVSSLRPQVEKFWGTEVRQPDSHDSRDSEP